LNKACVTRNGINAATWEMAIHF